MISPGLFEFTQYLREEKRVKPAFIDDIINYIYEQEQLTALMPHDDIQINVNLAAATIFDTVGKNTAQLPLRFRENILPCCVIILDSTPMSL